MFSYHPRYLGGRTHQQKQGTAFRLHRSASVHAATPTARCQGKKHPLTVLISVAFALQRNGSGRSSLAMGLCLEDTFYFFLSMGISICRHG